MENKMTNIKELQTAVDSLGVSIDKYIDNPTKAESKRIRLSLGEIKKYTPALRKLLVEQDQNS